MSSKREKPEVALKCIAYADAYSVGGDSERDYEIGVRTELVGSNKALTNKRAPASTVAVFVLFTAADSEDRISFAGFIDGPSDGQPWEDEGGQHWSHVYEVFGGHVKSVSLRQFGRDYDVSTLSVKAGARWGCVQDMNKGAFLRALADDYWL